MDPDTQPVADAVRASAGVPFFFRPFQMTANPDVTQGHGEILCTDGGMLSGFPVDVRPYRRQAASVCPHSV